MMKNLDAKDVVEYAKKVYQNPQCMTQAEFIEDYKRFKYIKRLCRRYLTTQTLSERLMLNHLVLLTNVFGVEPTVRILFCKCDNEKLLKVLKPFLLYLRILPRVVFAVNGKNINTDKISLDEKLYRRLKELV